MTLQQRLLAIPALAGVLYFSVILAGLPGFDLSIWALYVAIFLIWHVLMHVQGPALPIVLMVHGVVAAAFLGIGALIGSWLAVAPSPILAVALGAGATALARMLRIPPERAAELAALAEEAAARDAAARPAPEPEPEPEPEPVMDPDAEEEAIAAALAALEKRLDALPSSTRGSADLAGAITPALGAVPQSDLVSTLFARARAHSCPRDLHAVITLLALPGAARPGEGDAEAAFHLIRAAHDGAALADWAAQSAAAADRQPDLWADLPENADLDEAAAALPAAAEPLRALAARRPRGEATEGEGAP